nr:EOG090X0DPX [Lepidurus arcticus]
MSQSGKVSSPELDEKASISFLTGTKSVRKYGSTAQHQPATMKASSRVIEHKVQPHDTLQGLALRYETTMEHIKRFNRLWTNDSLFLRESLKIPVSEDFRDKEANFRSTIPSTSQESPTHIGNHNSSIVEGCDNSFSSQNTIMGTDSNLKDFLGRMDSSIEQGKLTAEKLQDINFDLISVLFIFSSLILKHPAFGDAYSNVRLRRSQSSRLKSNSSAQNSCQTTEFGPPSNSEPYVATTGKKVWSSLQRLEQTQDEMFEL